MDLHRLLVLLFVVICVNAAPAAAQVTTSTSSLAPRGVVGVAGGISAASGTSGGAFAVTTTFNLTDRLALEGNGIFSMSHGGMDSQSVTASLLVNLMPARDTQHVVPYVAGGVGLYRASFDMDAMGFGNFMNQYTGYSGMMSLPTGGFGMMQSSNSDHMDGSPVYTPSDMRMFYGDRMGVLTPANGRFGMRSFTDPAVSFGIGAQIRVGAHLVVRPDARAITAIANGNSRTVGVVSIGLGYGF